MRKLIIAGILLGSLGAVAAGKLQNSDFATGADILAAGGSLSQLLNTSKIWDSTNSQLLDTTIAGKLNLSGGTMTGTLTSRSIVPSASATYSVGASGNVYLNGYFQTLNTQTVNRGTAGVLTVQTTAPGTDVKLNPASGVIDASSAVISNVASPVVGTDAANKNYITNYPAFTGDSGSGGVKGFVPAPSAGDGAAGKVLKADGTWGTAGTASPLTTKGDIYGFDTTNARIPVGADGYVLTADSTQALGVKWAAGGSGSAITSLTGEVTATGPGAAAATITNSAVTNAKLANMPSATIKGNNTGGAAAPLDLTGSQVTSLLDTFTTSLKGLAPASGGGTANFLRADGSWAAPAGSSPLTTKGDLYTYSTTNDRLPIGTNGQILTPNSAASTGMNWVTTLPTAAVPGFTGGDVTSSAGSLALSIGNSTVTNAKMANMAANTFKANNTASPAAPSDITGTQATALLDTFTTSLKGLAPASGGGAFNFLRADGTWASPAATARVINQVSHGFSVGQVVYFNGSVYALAKADADSTSEVLGVVSQVIDADNFRFTMTGYVTNLSGLVAGTTYYLSDTTAGALSATAPVAGPSINKPVLVAVSTTTGYVLQSRGYTIGPASTPYLTMSDWIAYTPTFTNFGGTPTSISAFYRRVGQDIEIRMNFTLSGTPSGTNTITLPSGLLVDSTKVPSGYSLFGKVTNSSVNTTWSSGVIAQGSASVFSLAREASSGGITPTSTSGDIGNTGQTLSLFASIPIAGWTATSSGQVSAPRSEITVDTGNVYGSTATMIPRFSNTRKNIGSSITYADSSTNGASFTVNEDGIYAISYSNGGGGGCGIGITVNESLGTTGTTSITNYTITYAQGFRAISENATSGRRCFVGWSGNLSAGDVVRPHDNGNSLSSSPTANFSIVKVSN